MRDRKYEFHFFAEFYFNSPNSIKVLFKTKSGALSLQLKLHSFAFLSFRINTVTTSYYLYYYLSFSWGKCKKRKGNVCRTRADLIY